MRAYSICRTTKRAPGQGGRSDHRGLLVLVAFSGFLVGCTSQIKDAATAYVVTGNYDDIASCLYRKAEGSHTFGRDVHLTRLSNPAEIRVAVSLAGNRGGIASLSWEVELLPRDASTVRLLVRQSGTLLESGPFWSSYLEPAITLCAGSPPQPAP